MKPKNDPIDIYLKDLSEQFEIGPKDHKDFITAFQQEMARGLKKEQSSLKMISSFVKRPTGREKGRYLALDLGGTNFRVMAVELSGSRSFKVLSTSKYVIPKELMTGDGKLLFDFIASQLGSFLDEKRLSRAQAYGLGFTFSFPVAQTGVNSGRLIHWTKGFKAKGVEGNDVVAMLKDALQDQKIDCISVDALANDTVGTLMTKSYELTECYMGVILGTGTNACYPEEKSREGVIINTEWGNFNKFRSTIFDERLDQASHNKGEQLFEKAVSGMYLGEIFRLILADMAEKGLVQEAVNGGAYSMSGEDLSQIASREGLPLFKKIAGIVSSRSAKLAASAVASVLLWEDKNKKKERIVAIDGSLYEKYPGYRETMCSFLKDINVRFELAKDGSGIGAAIIAAVARGANDKGAKI